MRFISQGDVAALAIGIDEVIAALEAAFLAARRGDIAWKPKSMVSRPDGAFLIATHAAWPERNFAIFHSIMGTSPANVPPGLPHYRTTQLLADYAGARPIALIDGTFASMILPAGVTAIVARLLARPDSRTACFVAAGSQARVNLDALRARFPLEEVRIISRTARSAEAFAVFARKRGLTATIYEDPEIAVRGADIIVTSVPSGPGVTAFLDPGWVSPGGLVSAIDGGRSWRTGIAQFERLVSDDREQALVQHAEGRLSYGGPYDSEIPELLDGSRPARQLASDRVAFIHPGNVVGIFGISALVYERAVAGGRGQDVNGA